MATTIPAIEVSGLHKNFGRTDALSGLDLRVESGQVAGFLGPNGAGKSTTIRILLGLLKADGGHARMLGADPWADAVALHRRVAYVPGEVNLWPNLTGGQAISILSKLHGQVDEQRRSQLLERFDLDPSKKARSYSKGNRQKVALVAALVIVGAAASFGLRAAARVPDVDDDESSCGTGGCGSCVLAGACGTADSASRC